MKKLIAFLFFSSLIGVCTGFYYKSGNEELGNKIIGLFDFYLNSKDNETIN